MGTETEVYGKGTRNRCHAFSDCGELGSFSPKYHTLLVRESHSCLEGETFIAVLVGTMFLVEKFLTSRLLGQLLIICSAFIR